MKKITAIVLSLTIAFSMSIPVCAYADDDAAAQEGVDNGTPAVSEEAVTDDEPSDSEDVEKKDSGKKSNVKEFPYKDNGALYDQAYDPQTGRWYFMDDNGQFICYTDEVPLNPPGYTNWEESWESFTKYNIPSINLRVVGTTSIKISWDTDPSVNFVEIYRKRAGSSYSWHMVKTAFSGHSWTNKNLRKNTKYYYYVVYYNPEGGSYETYTDYEKTRPNSINLGCSDDYGDYGDVTFQHFKVSYDSKHRLKVKIRFYNERYLYAKKYKYFTIRVYDNDGELIGKQTFRNVYLGLKSYKKKWKTFTFSKSHTYQKHLNLRYDCDDYYTTYKISWRY